MYSGDIFFVLEENGTTVKFDELEGVYVSVPISIGGTGFSLKRDMALDYNDGIWHKKFN